MATTERANLEDIELSTPIFGRARTNSRVDYEELLTATTTATGGTLTMASLESAVDVLRRAESRNTVGELNTRRWEKLKGKRKLPQVKKSDNPTQISKSLSLFVSARKNLLKAKYSEQIHKNEETVRQLAIGRKKQEQAEYYYKKTVIPKRNLVSRYKEAVLRLRQYPLVANIERDEKHNMVITTKMLAVRKPSWREAKEVGIYKIRLDFSQNDIRDGIIIINTTRSFNEYDSPTIKNGTPCWGNMESDIQWEFLSQDIYELVVDLIDYIVSPDDEHGFLEWSKEDKPENYKGGWEQFLEKSEIKNRDFSDCKDNLTQTTEFRGTIDESTGAVTFHGHPTFMMTEDPRQIHRRDFIQEVVRGLDTLGIRQEFQVDMARRLVDQMRWGETLLRLNFNRDAASLGFIIRLEVGTAIEGSPLGEMRIIEERIGGINIGAFFRDFPPPNLATYTFNDQSPYFNINRTVVNPEPELHTHELSEESNPFFEWSNNDSSDSR